MTRSGIQTAFNRLRGLKKENNNKDYRTKPDASMYSFSSGPLNFDYILRTKYGIKLNQKNKNFLRWDYRPPFITPLALEGLTPEENAIIEQEIRKPSINTNIYESRDHTHIKHSKENTRMRKHDRTLKQDWQNDN
jgi:hypothetical protein